MVTLSNHISVNLLTVTLTTARAVCSDLSLAIGCLGFSVGSRWSSVLLSGVRKVMVPMTETLRVQSLGDITNEVLQRVLNDSRPPSAPKVTVTSFTHSDAVPKGENFTSSLYRFHVTTQTEGETPSSKSLIVKLTPDTPQGQHMIQEVGCFPREVSMYNKYVPHLESELGMCVAPKLYLGKSWGPHGVLVMEDLKENGFHMLKRITCDDVALCGRVVKLLARMHAVGHKLVKSGLVGSLYDEYPFPENFQDVLSEMMEAGMTKAVEGTLAHSPDLQKHASDINSLCKFRAEHLFFPVFTSDNSAFRTLLHGDCWNNNMMVRADGAEIKLVDWQLARLSLGPKELQYFLYSSTEPDFRLRHLEAMYRLYHETYLDSLSEAERQHPDYTYVRFKEECSKDLWYPFSLALVFKKRSATPQVSAEIDINKSTEEMKVIIKRMEKENAGKTVGIIRGIISEFLEMGLVGT